MKKLEQDYSVGDLSRALIREYLTQKNMKNTLEAFEKEDLNNKRKINKSLLIDMVSLKNLCYLNKQTKNPLSSLLEVLVSYLNKKYQGKKNTFATTQPQRSFPTMNDALKKTNEEPLKIVESKEKVRPSTSKPSKRENNQIDLKIAPTLQKQELKILYNKLKLEQPTQSKNINQKQVIQTQNKNKQQKQSKCTNLPLSYTQPIEVEEEYNQDFDQQLPLVVDSNKNKNEKDQEKIREPPQLFKIQKPIVSLPRQNQQKIIKEVQIIINKDQKNNHNVSNEKFKQNNQVINSKQKQKQQLKLIKQSSQQKLDPAPIVHSDQPFNAHASFQIPSKTIQTDKVIEDVKNQVKSSAKPRSQMRMINKSKESLLKMSQQTEKKQEIQNKNYAVQVNKQFIKTEQKQEQQQKNKQNQSQPNIQKQSAGGQMMIVGKKRKQKQQNSKDEHYPTKFKFDQNFKIDIPVQIKYQYQQYNFTPIILQENVKEMHPTFILSNAINYKQKGGGIPSQKKKQQKIIPSSIAQKLKKIVFQSGTPVLPKSWLQGFILSPFETTPYILKQIEGGPCGIIAAVQCYFLKHLLYCSKQNSFMDQILREVCLVAAFTDMLWKVKSSDKIILTFPTKGTTKIDINNLKMIIIDANDFETAFSGIWSYREQFIGNNNHGVASLLYSSVLTRGFEKIQQEIDCKENPLIGNHGHCTQQFVNMLLTGKAISNCFDGDKLLQDYKLRGITQKAEFGFLTIFETLKYIEVGKNLKNPVFPAWVICKEFHYHVIFAPNYLISQNNKTQKFDIIYIDGLYNCGDKIRLTLQPLKQDQQQKIKLKDLPLIQQVMMTKWGHKKVNWNGSVKIL